MKPIGNIAKYADLSKPLSGADIKRALARAKAAQRPISIRQVAKAGYGLELIQPTEIARACALVCGRAIRPIPRFVSES